MGRAATVLVLCLLPLAAPRAAFADAALPWEGTPFAAPGGELARAAAAAPGRGEGILMLLEEAEYTFDALGRRTYRYHAVFRVDDDSAREDWTDVGITWAPWYQDRPEIKARVVGRDGQTHVLDPATLAESGVGREDEDMYSDRRRLSAPLPAFEVGAVVEQEILLRDNAPWFGAGSFGAFYFGNADPVRHARLVIDAPAGHEVKWVTELLPGLQPSRETGDERVRLTFDRRDLPPLPQVDDAQPPDAPRWPRVAFSTGSDWGDIASRYSAIVDRQLDGGGLEKLVREWGLTGLDRRALVDRALARLHREVRYTGVEFGEATIVPRGPREVLARRYGDCKDKAALLVGLLRAAGVPASVALLSSGGGRDVMADLPAMGQFDHAIVFVPGEPELWIDATADKARAGELPIGVQERLALVADPATRALRKTPKSRAADNGSVEIREFKLSELGPSEVTETTEYQGAHERSYRAEYAGSGGEDERKRFEEYVRAEYLAEKLGVLEKREPSDLTRPFQIRLSAVAARRGLTDDKEAVVAFFPAHLTDGLPTVFTDAKAPLSERHAPYYFAQPHFQEQRFRIVPPPGFVPRELPPSEEKLFGPARLLSRWEAAPDGVVTGSVRFESGPRQISADEFTAMRAAVRQFRAEGERAAFVKFAQKGEVALAEGRIADGIAEFRRLVALHPREGLHHTQIALGLLAAGSGDAAREEARRAVAVEPTSALALRRLGWVLQHDLVGRRFGRGFDMEGAEAAYRKAVAADPKDAMARTNLAYLLEFDADGERWSSRAKSSEAADLYSTLARESDQPPMTNLIYALLASGRHGELAEATGRFTDPKLRATFETMTAAVTDGPAAAVRRAAQIPSADERRQALGDAADQLVRLRRYADAAALLREAAPGSVSAAALQGRADVLARVRKAEDLPPPSDDPRSVVDRLLRGLLLGWDAGRLRAESRMRPGGDGVDASDMGLKAVRAAFERERRKAGLSTEVFADITLALMALRVEGDESAGWRVTARAERAAAESSYFVVREAEGLRLLASDTALEDLGVEALARLERQDKAGAHRLLDWAREEAAGNAEDPFGGAPITHLWSQGDAPEAERMRWAAASLLVLSPSTARRGIDLLEAARSAAPSDDARDRFDAAILAGRMRLEQPDAVLALIARLGGREASSPSVLRARTWALMTLKRPAELQKVLEARLRDAPRDLWALRSLRLALAGVGDFAGIDTVCASLAEMGRSDAVDDNDCAWNVLATGGPLPAAIERARSAVDRTGRKDRAILHTLASLHAEAGQPAEARQIILEAMAAAGEDAPSSVDWYVFGRIAESYGLKDSAAAAYRRVEKSELGNSTYALAARRLSALFATRPAVAAPARGKRGR